MRFRFTLSRAEKPVDPLPNLDTWENRGLVGRDPWTLGASPTVDLTGVGIGGTSSDELYTDYNFIPGEEYTITVEYTRLMNILGGNPRHMRLYIYSDLYAIQHQLTDTTAVPPPDSVTQTFSLTFTADADCKKIALYYASGSDVSVTLDDVDISVTLSGINTYYINEPDGWKDCILKLERDKIFHSLIEHFEGSFIFYGDNGVINGGYHILKDWDLEDGPDADITLLIEYTDNNTEFFEIFSGQLDMSLAEWMIDNKVRIPIIKDSFWATFMNRKETPVNLIAPQDLDDEEVEELVDDISIDLPSQKIRYNGEYRWLDSFTYEFEEFNQEYAMQVDWDETVVDDVRKFSLPRAMVLDPENDGVNTGEDIVGIFEAPWDGDYTFDVRLEVAFYNEDDNEWRQVSTEVNFWMHGVDDFQSTEARFDEDNESEGPDSWTIFTFNKTVRASKGQQFKIYGTFAGPVVSGDLPRYTIFGERQLTWYNVTLATTGSITLFGEQSIDGTMTAGTTVLVRNQGDSSLNGVYTSSAVAWTRIAGLDTAAELVGAAVYVTAGDDNAETAWRQSEEEIDLGSTAITWVYMIPNDERLRPYPGTEVQNYFKITADTTFRKTKTTGFLLHDAGAAILKHYGLGQVNPFYSEVLGSDRTLARQYEENGCFWPYGLTRGLQLRGYSMAEKSFSMSFMEWWQGADPIFNLGLGYEALPGSVTQPETIEVAALPDWEDAAGNNPGSWTYTSPAVPHTSVNGSGGVSGYTKGAVATLAGQLYSFSFVLEILDTGVSGEISEVTVAILDAADNEIETIVFNYTDAGFKFENFTITPTTAGTSIGLRITNNTPFDTKVFYLRYFVGGQANQFLENYDFADTSEWVGDGGGFPWVITGGAATLDLPSGVSERLTDTFSDAGAGRYLLVIRRTSTNFDTPTDSANFAVQVYDADDNIIDGSIEFITGNNVTDVSHTFTTAGIPAKVKMLMEVNSGADMNVSVDFVMLFGPVSVDAIVVEPETRIRVEKMEYFYDPEPVVFLSNIRDITRRYDTEKIYKKILIGYKQWKTEDISGIDDPQTKHTYATQLRKSGEEIEVLSEFIGASLAVEQARRQSIDKSTDYQFDDSTFIIALNSIDESVSPDSFVPETDENFTTINNLLNSETRYNIRITPARNFLRHINKFNIGLQSYIGSMYRFTRGEGNYDVETAMLSSCDEEDYGSQLLGENDNLRVTSDAVHTSYYYDIEFALSLSSYKAMAANKNKAIGVSQTDFDHIPFLIDTLSYQLAKGTVQISGWTKEYWDITTILGNAPTQDCTLAEICENPITDELQNILADDEGNCIVWTL